MHEVTQEFSKISANIIAITHTLAEEKRQEACAGFIRSIQNNEKEKLELVVRLQLSKQCVQDNEGEQQTYYEKEVKELKQRICDIEERINEHLEELKYEVGES